MDATEKAARVLELLRQKLADASLGHSACGGMNVFESDRGDVKHRICYPDTVLAGREPEDLATVAAAIFTLLRCDPGPVRVVVRSGIFETMLREQSSNPQVLTIASLGLRPRPGALAGS